MQEKDYTRDREHEPHNVITEYIVEEKDTLGDLCKRYNVSLQEIKDANPDIDTDSDMIEPGKVIKIPKPRDSA